MIQNHIYFSCVKLTHLFSIRKHLNLAKCFVFFFLDLFTDEELERYLNSNPSPGSTSAQGNIYPITAYQNGIDVNPPLNIENELLTF